MPEGNRETSPALRTSEQLLAAQNLVLEMIAVSAPLDAVLRALAAFIDQQEPPGMCGIFLLDPDGRTLGLGAAPKLPETFLRALRPLPIGPNCGANRTAAFRRERVVVSDISTDPLYQDYREMALGCGLRSCWSTPIISSEGAALGTLAVYHGQPHIPAQAEIGAVERAAWLARIAIERNRSVAQLQAGRELFRSLIENTSDVIALLDANGVIRYLSSSGERVLGFHPSELVGTSGFDCLHPDDQARAREAFQQALQRPGACMPLEQRFRHKDGSWRTLEIRANNQVGDPAVGGVIVTGHDITDRKRAEEDLASSQSLYREMFENATDVLYTHDLAGTLTSLNKAGEALTGYSRQEALGTNIGAIIAPEHRALVREMTARKIGGEAKTTYELEIITKQGARLTLEASTRLVFQMGRPVAVQAIARDITERRRFESHLLQSQKMEAIGRLAGGVAHDFNNLLTVISGYSEWMLDELPPDSPFAENAWEILLAAGRGAALTNQLLAFSHNQVIQPIVVDLNRLVGELDPMLRRILGEGIQLTAVLSPNLGLVRADPGQIEQVILNLVFNARDALLNGGKLSIETANVDIDEERARSELHCPAGAYVMLAVADTGCGIDERIKAHIFEPFFTTKEKGKGTGLGLSTVYGIVNQGGGHIQVENQPGGGAAFRIYLPKVADGESATPIPPRRSRSRGDETILLVEDEPVVRRVVGEMLRRLGYAVLEAPDGRTAQELVRGYGQPIQLLLTDVVMPDSSGRKLARQLRAGRNDLKVLFMSGYAGDAVVRRSGFGPGTAYLQKPFTADALSAKIREVLDRS